MKPTHPRETQEPIKIIGEHKFYDIRQSDQLLHSRYMMAEVQEMYIRSGLSEDFLKGISQLIIDRSMDAKDLKGLREDMMAIGQNLKGRIGFIAEAKMYERMACVYFMMDDEPDEYSEAWANDKIAVWRAAKQESFFIEEAFKRITNLADISTTDILAALIAASERIAQLPELTHLPN